MNIYVYIHLLIHNLLETHIVERDWEDTFRLRSENLNIFICCFWNIRLMNCHVQCDLLLVSKCGVGCERVVCMCVIFNCDGVRKIKEIICSFVILNYATLYVMFLVEFSNICCSRKDKMCIWLRNYKQTKLRAIKALIWTYNNNCSIFKY